MNILALENTLDTFSLALSVRGEIAQFIASQRSAAERFPLALDFLLSHAGISLGDIDAYVMGTGPGSFTGMRVCLSIVKGMAAAIERPCVGVPSYRAVIEQYAEPDRPCAVIFDAKKDSVYGAVYRKTDEGVICMIPEGLYSLESFLNDRCGDDYYFLGESVRFAQRIREVYPYAQIASTLTPPEARFLIPSAEVALRSSQPHTVDTLELLYIHPDTCTVTR
jgi:tRNA threonylcarbamoyladenosine biosynthesis protein TsaB